MLFDRTPGTIIIRTGIHEPIIKRRVSVRIGERQENLFFVCHAAGRNRQLLQVYGVGTRLRNVASREVMSGNRLCIPGTNVLTPNQPLISVETASIRWLFQPRVDCGSRNRTPCRGAGDGKLRFKCA